MKEYLKLVLMLVFAMLANSGYGLTFESASGGLGAEIDIVSGSTYPRIVSTVSGFPAARIGLQANDLIIEIDGYTTQYLAIGQVVSKLRGTPGTVCHMLVRRFSSEYRVTFTRQRLYPEWASGKVDHYYHLKAAEQINYWYPTPGYVFIHPGTGDLTTQWKPGSQHPNYNVLSADKPNQWVPMPGYTFINKNSLATVWTPGIYLESNHIISAEKPGTWHAASGWKFVSDNSLKVVSVNDGIWSDTIIGTLELIVAGWLESWFGDNFISTYLYGKAWTHGKNVIETVIKL